MSILKKNQITPPEVQVQLDHIKKEIAQLKKLLNSKSEVPKKDWYRPSEVCQLMGISRAKFEAHKRSGFFQVHKIPGAGGVYVAASQVTNLFPQAT